MNLKNAIFEGANGRKSLYDLEIPANFNGEIIVFIHGYKGYKDWGCWHLVQSFFTEKGYGFCKFNTSHNGGTIENPIDFPDLKAFGENTYSFEVFDANKVIEILTNNKALVNSKITLIGHSRGGGIATLAAKNKAVKALITWASVSDYKTRFPKDEKFEEWKEKGVFFVKNGRTKQEMPHDFSFYEDFIENQANLDIKKNANALSIPALHIHGSDDTAVLPVESQILSDATRGQYLEVNNTGHTFNSSHPWNEENMPSKLNEVCTLTLSFLRSL